MASVTIISKGQVTIPVGVRHQLGIDAGDRIEFIWNDQTRHYEVVPATCSITALKGIIRKPAKPVSIEDMNAAIAAQEASARGSASTRIYWYAISLRMTQCRPIRRLSSSNR